MKRDWTDGDGQRWHVRAYNSVASMAMGGRIPDAGKNVITFRRHDTSDGYPIETRDLRYPNEMTDEKLQELLDQAKLGKELEG